MSNENSVMPPREGIKRGIYLLPNLLTLGSLFFGFFAIVKALHHDFESAAWAIMAAGIFDGLDGRVARLARAESQFGIELDSLVDLVSFGLAPALLMYCWSIASFDRIGWLATFIYIACGSLRLARFNVQFHTVERNYFQGLPIPCAASMITTTVIFYHHVFGKGFPVRNWWLLGMTAVLGLLMISTIRYRSFKQLDFRSRWSFFSLVFVVGLIAVIALEPEIMLFGLCALFVLTGVVEELVTMRKGRQMVARLRERHAQRIMRDKVRSLPRVVGHDDEDEA